METTFISIHNLEEDARILYSSDSVVDILGYTPDEIVNRSAWDFFPIEELPYARKFHQKKVSMDKAAVLAYCRVRAKDGSWIGCECCFTIVYDVMIVCTSIYRQGMSSLKRAAEAPIVRRIFSSSPRDPRYHMLSHLSAKFAQPAKAQTHEPRAALFLNRFTRTLTIMYATSGLRDVIGIPAEQMRGRSFYYCIAENCLQDAVKCLENAKGNDSIAYLRFWFRDPRQDDPPPPMDSDSDDEMTTDTSTGGVDLRSGSERGSASSNAAESIGSMDIDTEGTGGHSSSDSTNAADTHEAIFGTSREAQSSASSAGPASHSRSPIPHPADPIELEAVISCTSDGMVVCMRRARPMIPHPTHRPGRRVYENGLFAAPWAAEPMLPPVEARPGHGFGTGFAPALGPQGARHEHSPLAPPRPAESDFMNAIRDQAIFSWALTGINGALAEFGMGKPLGESVPKDGLPIWASDPRRGRSGSGSGSASASGASPNGSGNGNGVHSNGTGSGVNSNGSSMTPPDGRPHIFGDPGLSRQANGSGR